jgi:hypothetical protein
MAFFPSEEKAKEGGIIAKHYYLSHSVRNLVKSYIICIDTHALVNL